MLGTLRSYIQDNYGSKRGLAASAKYSLLQQVGYLRELRDVDFGRVRKVVVVCSGNICRSPFGELYARHIGLEAESYGIDCRGGDPPDPRVIEMAREFGIKLCEKFTRNIRDYQPSSEDLVLVMEPAQLAQLPSGIHSTAQVSLAPLWANNERIYLHDPFTGSPVYFKQCALIIMEALDTIAERLHEKTDTR